MTAACTGPLDKFIPTIRQTAQAESSCSQSGTSSRIADNYSGLQEAADGSGTTSRNSRQLQWTSRSRSTWERHIIKGMRNCSRQAWIKILNTSMIWILCDFVYYLMIFSDFLWFMWLFMPFVPVSGLFVTIFSEFYIFFVRFFSIFLFFVRFLVIFYTFLYDFCDLLCLLSL